MSQQLYSVKFDNKNNLVYAIDYYIKGESKIMGSNIFILDRFKFLFNHFTSTNGSAGKELLEQKKKVMNK